MARIALPRSSRGEGSRAVRIHMTLTPRMIIQADAVIPFLLSLLNTKAISAPSRQTQKKYADWRASVFRREEAMPEVSDCRATKTNSHPIASAETILRMMKCRVRSIIPALANLPGRHGPRTPCRWQRCATPIRLRDRGALEVYPTVLSGSDGRECSWTE